MSLPVPPSPSSVASPINLQAHTIDIADKTGRVHAVALHATHPYKKRKLYYAWTKFLTVFGIRKVVIVKIDRNTPALFVKITDIQKLIENKKTVKRWAKAKSKHNVAASIRTHNLAMVIRALGQLAPGAIDEDAARNLRRLADRVDYRTFTDIAEEPNFRSKKMVHTMIAVGRALPTYSTEQGIIQFGERPEEKKYGITLTPDHIVVFKVEQQERIELDLETQNCTTISLQPTETVSATPAKKTTPTTAGSLINRLFSKTPKKGLSEEDEFMSAVQETADLYGLSKSQKKAVRKVGETVPSRQMLLMLGKVEGDQKKKLLQTYATIGDRLERHTRRKYVGRDKSGEHFAFAIIDSDIFINVNSFSDEGGFKRISGGYHLNTLDEVVRIKPKKSLSLQEHERTVQGLESEIDGLNALHATNNPHVMMPLTYVVRGRSNKEHRQGITIFQTRYEANGKTLKDAEVFHQVAGFQNIAAGLAHMHSNGFVHCDVKAANILLSGNLYDDTLIEAKLSDFGAMKTTGLRLTQQTSFYLPPEAQRIAIAEPALDAFALGVTILKTIAPAYRLPELGRLPESQRDRELDRVNTHIRKNNPSLTKQELEAKVAVLSLARRLLRELPTERCSCAEAANILAQLENTLCR